MQEFATTLKVELEHGKLKAVNVTNNNSNLTAMIALVHMIESLTYYKRLQVMEAESKIYEIIRKLGKSTKKKEKLHLDLIKIETVLNDFKKSFLIAWKKWMLFRTRKDRPLKLIEQLSAAYETAWVSYDNRNLH